MAAFKSSDMIPIFRIFSLQSSSCHLSDSKLSRLRIGWASAKIAACTAFCADVMKLFPSTVKIFAFPSEPVCCQA